MIFPTNIANMCIPISKPQLSFLVIVDGVDILYVQSNELTNKQLMITSINQQTSLICASPWPNPNYQQ